MIAQQVVREEQVGKGHFQREKHAGTKERVRWKTSLSKGECKADGEEWGGREDIYEGEMSQVKTGWREAPEHPVHITVVSLPVS